MGNIIVLRLDTMQEVEVKASEQVIYILNINRNVYTVLEFKFLFKTAH